jgi:uncharacterized protein (DUF2141 family)
MKHVLRPAVLLMLMCPILTAQEVPETGNLRVIVSGLKSDKGNVKIGLFNSAGSYQGKSPKWRGSSLPITDRRVEWLIEGVPFGEYAVKLFHDEDQDDRVDRNFIGMPSEDIGFSNNARIGLGGAPGFNRAKFHLESPEMTIVIELNQ